MDPIVSVEWLRGHLDDVIICHVGTSMAGTDPRQEFRTRHLPGARYVSLDDDLAALPGPAIGRHPLPTATAFADTLAALGVDGDAIVVAYDTRNGAFASRLVWMLRILGQNAGLLDGGLDAWDGDMTDGDATPDPVQREAVEWPSGAVADSTAVATHIAGGGIVIDSRDPARFRGEIEPIDAVAGHVPGAINLPFTDNIVDGRFRSADDLADRFAAVAADPDAIVYCGSGVTACHNALAIEAAGLPLPRVYVGSWSGWSTEPNRPIATT